MGFLTYFNNNKWKRAIKWIKYIKNELLKFKRKNIKLCENSFKKMYTA